MRAIAKRRGEMDFFIFADKEFVLYSFNIQRGKAAALDMERKLLSTQDVVQKLNTK